MPKNSNNADFLIIGAGIAGASVAAEISKSASVILAEMESQPGYHTTGRSAALYVPTYGPAPIRALTRASRAFLFDPPGGFSESPILSPRAILTIARSDQMADLERGYEEFSNEAPIELLDERQTCDVQPLLRPGYAAGSMLDRSGYDIDVHGLHQGYLRMFRANGGELRTSARVDSLKWAGRRWHAEIGGGTVRAATVVNAAGAWADAVGQMAGAEGIGLVPKRRTVLVVAAPTGTGGDGLPATADLDEQFYLKPDAGRLLISPANEDPDRPSDVQPDEMDVAICIDRIERAFELEVRRIENKWAGLRSFVADKCPVCGFSNLAEKFFWLAGQGGYGIQTAPALSRYAAAVALGEPVSSDIVDHGFDPASLSPDRL